MGDNKIAPEVVFVLPVPPPFIAKYLGLPVALALLYSSKNVMSFFSKKIGLVNVEVPSATCTALTNKAPAGTLACSWLATKLSVAVFLCLQ